MDTEHEYGTHFETTFAEFFFTQSSIVLFPFPFIGLLLLYSVWKFITENDLFYVELMIVGLIALISAILANRKKLLFWCRYFRDAGSPHSTASGFVEDFTADYCFPHVIFERGSAVQRVKLPCRCGYITVNNEKYYVPYAEYLYVGDYVRLTYLPTSKIVMSYTITGGYANG